MVTNSMEKAQGSFPYLYTLFITFYFGIQAAVVSTV